MVTIATAGGDLFLMPRALLSHNSKYLREQIAATEEGKSLISLPNVEKRAFMVVQWMYTGNVILNSSLDGTDAIQHYVHFLKTADLLQLLGPFTAVFDDLESAFVKGDDEDESLKPWSFDNPEDPEMRETLEDVFKLSEPEYHSVKEIFAKGLVKLCLEFIMQNVFDDSDKVIKEDPLLAKAWAELFSSIDGLLFEVFHAISSHGGKLSWVEDSNVKIMCPLTYNTYTVY